MGRVVHKPRSDIEPELLDDFEMPRRKVRIGKATRALMEMAVSKKEPLFFECPADVTMNQWAARVGSWIACARRNMPGQSYSKRIVEFAEGDGVAVWRVK